MSNCRFGRCGAFVDARLADGTRVHAVLGCLASPGTCISLRVPAQRSFSIEDCVTSGSLTPGAAHLLSRMIEAKLAFLISGGTGSGKTTLRLRHYLGWRIAAVPVGRNARYLRQMRALRGSADALGQRDDDPSGPRT
jgi:hypothetical protein